MKSYNITLTLEDIKEISQYTESEQIVNILWTIEFTQLCMKQIVDVIRNPILALGNVLEMQSFIHTLKRHIVYNESFHGGIVAKMNRREE